MPPQTSSPNHSNGNNINNSNNPGREKSSVRQKNGSNRKVDRFGFIVSEGDEVAVERIPTFGEMKRKESRKKKWESMIQSWDTFRKRRHRLVVARLRKGLPDDMRGQVWVLLGNVKHNIEVKHVGLYQKLVDLSAEFCIPEETKSATAGDRVDNGSGYNRKENGKNENNTSTSNLDDIKASNLKSFRYIQEIIERDIPRTYPRHNLFYEDENTAKMKDGVPQNLHNQGVSTIMRDLDVNSNHSDEREIQKQLVSGVGGQAALRRVLNAYNYYDSEVGYCQGMNFIAGMFLTLMSEEETFWLLVAIMKEEPCYMRGLFGKGMSEAHLVLYVADKLIHNYLPKLAKHFEEENVDVTMFATQWLLTQYTSSFKFDLVFRVWDCYLAEGWKITYRVMLAILQLWQPQLLKMSFEEILNFFRDLPNRTEGATIMYLAMQIPLRQKQIQKYEQEWKAKQEKEQKTN